jgi:hypothetical protein
MVIFQVTIPAGGKVNITNRVNGSAIPANIPTATYVQQLVIQNNAGHTLRIGDSTVSSTKGIVISPGSPGGMFNGGGFINYGSYLSDWWLFGTSADVIDILYIA